ncbi:hypothetical protein L1987_77493 [Smallanthus sonchifolius]|uniref:Uncharacterized protein n=1 Tax=Smallanthus sonchifolius TaxID=185202 RepID=A0ACB8ZB16_9ASTR|nr:hypothetical protein L1987_77493 [Smallanthus sonchifolius]
MGSRETAGDDDFIHHMTDLQALNFGVLDSGRLENHIPPGFNNDTPLVETRISRIKKKIQETPNGTSSSKERLPPHDVNETRVTPFRTRSLEQNRKKHDLDMYEQPVLKATQLSSPSRRFSLSFRKMATTYNLKECTNQASPQSANDNWKKSNATNPSRSSPLRRFLDPLLKPYWAENVHKFKLEPCPSTDPIPMDQNELLRIKKHISSNVQALLQLKLKNGIPFFKFAVEGSGDILAAAVKKLPFGKDDTSLIYAFYSVRESKKKKSGGWIHQSSKEKAYSFEYNIVGQMKICSSYHDEFSGPEKGTKGLNLVRESVLYSTETLDSMLDGELAAIIVKNTSGESWGGMESRSRTTTVVLPDCVHSWPISGSPSTLINRWRSGGACDCGGWDIGCQFHVLSSHQNEIITTPFTSNHLELCYQVFASIRYMLSESCARIFVSESDEWRCLQVGNRNRNRNKNECSFKLVSVADGLYSLEYEPSMSLLQAFSICVAVVSSHNLTNIFQVNHVPESKDLCRPILADDETVRNRVSKPPASPVEAD